MIIISPISNVTWVYNSDFALSKDITIESGEHHPDDPVLFSSGASGVDSHSVKDGWLEIESGGGNGRVYWNYHELPEFEQLEEMGFNTVMTGTFKMPPEMDNLSIKDGNHGTNGWVLDDQVVFGGFGLSIHETQAESKVEYWHNLQGKKQTFPYPNGKSIESNKEHKFFLTILTDRVNESVVLNLWLDFNDGDGWVHVMEDRTWSESNWDPGNVPNGDDKEDIEKGPSFIERHHIWTRANSDGILPIKDLMIGTTDFIS